MRLNLKKPFANKQVWLIILAILMVLVTFFNPSINARRNTYNYLVIVDITQSMNTRDYTSRDMPADRLSFVKATLKKILPAFPCGSAMGLGIFANKKTLLLFEPIEICSNYAVLDDTLSHIDWRMAWAGDSNVRRGLYRALVATTKLSKHPHLIFFSDGESTIDDDYPAPLNRLADKAGGIIIGVGGRTPTPIPKLDQDNMLTGYWKREEISNLQFSRQEKDRHSNHYLSSVDETNLKHLANLSNLHYHRLESSENLIEILISDQFAVPQSVNLDIRWLCALVALMLLLTIYVKGFQRAA